MAFKMTAKNIANLDWHDVKNQLPDNSAAGIIIAGHLDDNGNKLTAGVAFYNPYDKTWARIISGPDSETGECTFTIEDITDWVDGWALIPDEMLDDEEAV